MWCELIKKEIVCVVAHFCKRIADDIQRESEQSEIYRFYWFFGWKFHGDQFWLNCYFSICLTIEPNHVANSDEYNGIGFFSIVFFDIQFVFSFWYRLTEHYEFDHKFIFYMIFFSLKKSTILSISLWWLV